MSMTAFLRPYARNRESNIRQRCFTGIAGEPIVIVNTAKGTVGEDTAALIGGTLINLVGLVVGEQASIEPSQRRPVTLLVDEFHSMPGADYEAILAELAKYGANLVLATQSLARLEALDREQQRGLRATVFANLDGLFAFHTSAEDARYLVRELGAELSEQDLVDLGEYQCYAKLSAGGERLPVFSVRLDPPPPSDPALRDQLATASAALYGRDWTAVEGDLRSALARIELARRAIVDQAQAGQSGAGVTKEAANAPPGHRDQHAVPKPARNDHRPSKAPRIEVHQATLFDPVPAEATDSDEPVLAPEESDEPNEGGDGLP